MPCRVDPMAFDEVKIAVPRTCPDDRGAFLAKDVAAQTFQERLARPEAAQFIYEPGSGATASRPVSSEAAPS